MQATFRDGASEKQSDWITGPYIHWWLNPLMDSTFEQSVERQRNCGGWNKLVLGTFPWSSVRSPVPAWCCLCFLPSMREAVLLHHMLGWGSSTSPQSGNSGVSMSRNLCNHEPKQNSLLLGCSPRGLSQRQEIWLTQSPQPRDPQGGGHRKAPWGLRVNLGDVPGFFFLHM